MNILTLPLGFLAANCYIVWGHDACDAVVIDPGAQPEKIADTLTEKGLTLKAILLTHGHHDHILGAPALQRKTGAPIYLHKADAACFHEPRVASLSGYPSQYRPPETVLTLEDGFTLLCGSLRFTCRHTPGHSAGSSLWHVVSQNREHEAAQRPVWFSGDTLFRFEIGRIDLYGGSREAMRETLRPLRAEREDADIYPGHGPKTTLFEEQQGNPYLRGTLL